ncbi:tripartite tricarboxylate transporter substrate binding protein [Xylophilus sp. GOD-11R]|uniref:Bug family tripartite tricarboxylate transporter substrate binding protein n=1 Tax=Xylophilus sp. GOD-11R TaxID=3089814 RepID=UPI00298C809E|nr:tripartite tricarboxylate transporter substrate binding protein [Xylophilus sp. GOD-11R]WPB57474.1 tripartite tricarboxylate transporter substrate binding protein [Xylophilus sp. GOD-11R]
MNHRPFRCVPARPDRRAVLRAGAIAAGAALPSLSFAQPWPAKPIRLVVPITPGGPSDMVGRMWADMVYADFGQSIVVDNKPGASHVVGTDFVAKAPADGYTLLQAASNMAINAVSIAKLPFDTVGDFAPVAFTHVTPLVVVVAASLPVKTLPELLDYLRKNGPAASYGTTGQGSPQQLAMSLLMQQASLQGPVEVPYKGSTQAHPDLLSGRLTLMIDPLAAVMPHVKSGSLRALAVTTAQRLPTLPDVPTVAEAGVPGYEVVSWGGVFAPARTPAAVIQRLNTAINKAVGSPEGREKLAGWGLLARTGTSEELETHLKAEIAKWGKVVQPVRA